MNNVFVCKEHIGHGGTLGRHGLPGAALSGATAAEGY